MRQRRRRLANWLRWRERRCLSFLCGRAGRRLLLPRELSALCLPARRSLPGERAAGYAGVSANISACGAAYRRRYSALLCATKKTRRYAGILPPAAHGRAALHCRCRYRAVARQATTGAFHLPRTFISPPPPLYRAHPTLAAHGRVVWERQDGLWFAAAAAAACYCLHIMHTTYTACPALPLLPCLATPSLTCAMHYSLCLLPTFSAPCSRIVLLLSPLHYCTVPAVCIPAVPGVRHAFAAAANSSAAPAQHGSRRILLCSPSPFLLALCLPAV